MSHPASILVYVGLDAVGDGLMKLPFLRALRAAFPAARITWLAGKGHTVYAGTLAPVVAGLVDEVLDQAGIGSRAAELFGPRPLHGRHFDLIIDTQRRLLTSLILRRVRHSRFISAAAGFWLSAARPGPGHVRPPAMVGQLMDLVALAKGGAVDAAAALTIDPATEAEATRLLPDGPIYVGLAPGAGGRQKCWPLDRFIAVGEHLTQQGRVPVFLLGPNEGDWAETIRPALPRALLPLQVADRVTPLLTIALGRRMQAAIANDSGTGHMLAAADVPLISLFGPTPAAKFAPAAQVARVIRAQDHGGDAMDRIPTQSVIEKLSVMLPL
ncbi:MAG: ADP-heptoseLPS [Rhodospirillaceae bacterium]|nr:MAG: ADP-heptoseLPS [Rhodospirillaceae bacterium]TNC98034.1 MAG: ADP-heptose:LPS heptosyltransferase [Stygiobacter sp.]